ncbi:50S ribosomal protein L24 [Candidatus Uhrbacteria bacterium]|nr:50S ribosomal protein L24 [Candidatus Uhrbacteria bacterium]
MTKFRIKTGDIVKIIAGKDKGKTGKVLQTFPKLNRVVVEGVNVSKRHLRARKSGEKGQTVEFSMPLHASNVLPVTDSGATVRHDDVSAGRKDNPKA